MCSSQPPGPALVAAAADADPVTLLVTAWLSARRSENTRAGYARDIGITPPRRPGRAPSWLTWCREQGVHPVTGVTMLHVARYARQGDADVPGVAGPGVLRPPGGQPGGHQEGHRIGVRGRGDQCGSGGLAAAHDRILSRIILDNRDYRGFTGFPVRRSSRRSAGIPQLPLSDRSQYCTVVAEQFGHFCSVQTQMSSSG